MTKPGKLIEDLDITPLRALRSFWSARIDVKKGSRLDPTSELLNVPGSIVLVHPQSEVVEEDYMAVRAWELDQLSRKLVHAY